MKFWLALPALGAAISLFAQQKFPDTRPSNQEQERVLNEVRTYAADYTKRLPDFICTQVTRRYTGDANRGIWNRPEVVMMRLSFFGQRVRHPVEDALRPGVPRTFCVEALGHTPRAHSQWHVKFENRASAVIGYRGLLYVDNDTGMVAKITAEAEDIPTTAPILQAWTELDYDFVTINAKEHLLPL